ncbi:MAG: Mu transposase domain-containing protein, partial [Bacillota bacterium]
EFDSLEKANDYLLGKLNKLNSIKKQRFANKSPLDKLNEEKDYLKKLMPTYDVARDKECRVNKYSFIVIEQNRYSVPDYLVGKFVMAKIYSDKIKIYYKDNLVAEHERNYKLHRCMIDIEHYLSTLKRKPGALRNSLALEKSAPAIKEIYHNFFDNNSIIKTKEFLELLEIIKEKGLKKVDKAIKRLAKNKRSMVTTDNIKTMVYRKKVNEQEQTDEIIENSLELLNNYNQVFNVESTAKQEVC